LFCDDLAVGDINGDGNLDVIMFRKGKEVVWFQAPDDPRGNWARHLVKTTSGEGLDVGDIDGDGDTDVAASRWWYENSNGSGTSWTQHTITSNWNTDCRDIIADFNFDGDIDVFTGEMHTSSQMRVLVYRNDGAGDSWIRKTLATTGTHNALVGDINGDKKPDIVGKNYNGTKMVECWENTMVQQVVGVGDTPAPSMKLLGNHPNPFGGRTSIEFQLSEPAHVRLSIYDVKGRLIVNLVDSRRDIGLHVADWDGRMISGGPVRAGIYFCRLTSSASSAIQTRKMVILK
jgi:hypothetical protein